MGELGKCWLRGGGESRFTHVGIPSRIFPSSLQLPLHHPCLSPSPVTTFRVPTSAVVFCTARQPLHLIVVGGEVFHSPEACSAVARPNDASMFATCVPRVASGQGDVPTILAIVLDSMRLHPSNVSVYDHACDFLQSAVEQNAQRPRLVRALLFAPVLLYTGCLIHPTMKLSGSTSAWVRGLL